MEGQQKAREVVHYNRNSFLHGLKQFKVNLERAAKCTSKDIVVDFANNNIEGYELRVLIPVLDFMKGERYMHIIAEYPVMKRLVEQKITKLGNVVMYGRPISDIEAKKNAEIEMMQNACEEFELRYNKTNSLDFLLQHSF